MEKPLLQINIQQDIIFIHHTLEVQYYHIMLLWSYSNKVLYTLHCIR